jgi:hypothetical protein
MNRKELLINHLRKSGYQLMEDDVYNIAKELREYDNDLILFFNPILGRYEVHTCTFFPSNRPTYCVSSNKLEDVFYKIKQADNRVMDFEEKMNKIDESKLKEEIDKAKKEADLRENFVKEVSKAETKHFVMG